PVSNGIDLSQFKTGSVDPSLYQKFGLPTDKPIIGYVGRLDAEKHLSVLVKAFDQVVKKKPAHLMLIGAGTDSENLKDLVTELHLNDQVTFTGRISEEDKIQLHRAPMVFAMPSPAELQSIATLEAMASGQPIVAVDAGALGELCQDGYNGYLCEPDNHDQIAESLLKIISDPEQRAQMSQNSQEIAAKHDINYTLDRFESIYQQLIKS